MNPVKKFTQTIKNNPVPLLTLTLGVGAGMIIATKMNIAHVYTLGHWHQELAKQGFEILIVTQELADKIAPLNQQ